MPAIAVAGVSPDTGDVPPWGEGAQRRRGEAYFGHNAQSLSGCFMRPASSPASGPQPAK